MLLSYIFCINHYWGHFLEMLLLLLQMLDPFRLLIVFLIGVCVCVRVHARMCVLPSSLLSLHRFFFSMHISYTITSPPPHSHKYHCRSLHAMAAELLPAICRLLAQPHYEAPDDTCLEKLLDWLQELITDGNGGELECWSCLSNFLEQAWASKDSLGSDVLSFSLRLAGMLAVDVHRFQHLQSSGLLELMFWQMPHACNTSLWDEARVRCAWLQAQLTMLPHPEAAKFICNAGNLQVIMSLCKDSSVFVVQAASRLAARLLNLDVEAKEEAVTTAQLHIVASISTSLASPTPGDGSWAVLVLRESIASGANSSRVIEQLRVPLQTCLAGEIGLWNQQIVGALIDLSINLLDLNVPWASPRHAWKLMQHLATLNRAEAGLRLAAGIAVHPTCPLALREECVLAILQPVLSAAAQCGGATSCSPTALLKPCSTASRSLIHISLHLIQGISKKGISSASAPLRTIITAVSQLLNHAITTDAGCSMSMMRMQCAATDCLSALATPYVTELAEHKDTVEEAVSVLLCYLKTPLQDAFVLGKLFRSLLQWLSFADHSIFNEEQGNGWLHSWPISKNHSSVSCTRTCISQCIYKHTTISTTVGDASSRWLYPQRKSWAKSSAFFPAAWICQGSAITVREPIGSHCQATSLNGDEQQGSTEIVVDEVNTEPCQAHGQQGDSAEVSDFHVDEPVASAMDSQCNDCDSDGGSSVASLSDGFSDHSLVKLCFSFPRFKRRTLYWSFNTSLLSDPFFKSSFLSCDHEYLYQTCTCCKGSDQKEMTVTHPPCVGTHYTVEPLHVRAGETVGPKNEMFIV
uniref:BRCA1-associated ATM activator 1-like n=1 Tax=Myxine glutinosa TaxID=7769 RepID=UPI00358F982A